MERCGRVSARDVQVREWQAEARSARWTGAGQPVVHGRVRPPSGCSRDWAAGRCSTWHLPISLRLIFGGQRRSPARPSGPDRTDDRSAYLLGYEGGKTACSRGVRLGARSSRDHARRGYIPTPRAGQSARRHAATPARPA